MGSHDVVIVTEAHLTPAVSDSVVSLPGFRLIRVHRSEAAIKKNEGGVVVYVREELMPYCTVVARDNSAPGCEILWLRIGMLTGRSLLLAACYLAPEMSKVYPLGGPSNVAREAAAITAFGRLQAGYAEHQIGTDDLLIAGDLNARVAGVRDIPLSDELDALRERFPQAGPDSQAYFGIRERSSCDAKANMFGEHLGQLCRSLGLVILNGRVHGDRSGSLTFPKDDGGG